MKGTINCYIKCMVARKGQKHRVANQTRRQEKNLTILLTNKQQKVRTVVLVNMNMCVKLRSKIFLVVSIRMS